MSKKLFLLFAVCTYARVWAQKDTLPKPVTFYVSAGISISNVNKANPAADNFNKASYPSIEVGLTKKNVSGGIVMGYENMLVDKTTRGFAELKTSFSYVNGSFAEYALFGVGAYAQNSLVTFIEYGVGFAWMPKSTGVFIQYSNWANANYVSVGITQNLN